MAKDQTKILKVVISKIEFGTTATVGVEPVNYADIGLFHDEKCSLKLTPIADREITGANFQKSYDAHFETSAMQVKDVATIEAYKNTLSWIKITDVSGAIYKVKDVYPNIDLDAQLHSKGKSAVNVTADRYVSQVSDIWTVA